MLDWVDPETAEVHQVDGLQHLLISEVAQREDFLGEHTAMVEAIFRVLLKNGNAAHVCVVWAAGDFGDQLERDAKHLYMLRMRNRRVEMQTSQPSKT